MHDSNFWTIRIIETNANIDANGDTINDDYISENATREIDAVRKLKKTYLILHRLFRLGLKQTLNIGGQSTVF